MGDLAVRPIQVEGDPEGVDHVQDAVAVDVPEYLSVVQVVRGGVDADDGPSPSTKTTWPPGRCIGCFKTVTGNTANIGGPFGWGTRRAAPASPEPPCTSRRHGTPGGRSPSLTPRPAGRGRGTSPPRGRVRRAGLPPPPGDRSEHGEGRRREEPSDHVPGRCRGAGWWRRPDEHSPDLGVAASTQENADTRLPWPNGAADYRMAARTAGASRMLSRIAPYSSSPALRRISSARRTMPRTRRNESAWLSQNDSSTRTTTASRSPG